MLTWRVRIISLVMGLVLACGFMAAQATADQDPDLQSSHFKFSESVLGGGGLVQSSSANYQVGESIGESAIGNSSSANYQVTGGNHTTADPALAVMITTPTSTFGTFSATTPATATSQFQVSDYTSYGYSVEITGSPPTNGAHVITPMSSSGASQTGTDQFGINLVANTSPVSFGANPNQGQFGVGTAAPNYATPNQFRYVNGETIATGPASGGITTYTISYLVNVGPRTVGGQYLSNQQLICIATY